MKKMSQAQCNGFALIYAANLIRSQVTFGDGDEDITVKDRDKITKALNAIANGLSPQQINTVEDIIKYVKSVK